MIKSIHIEATNLCTLKCAGCARTQFINNWPTRWKNHSIDIAALRDFLNIDLTGVEVHLCGTYGDPIYHPKFHLLIAMLKDKSAKIKITTNGSHKNTKWWNTLLDLLDADDVIEFSIDGMPDNFTTYRVNGDWSSIAKGIKCAAASSVTTGWKYIPFKFNEDCIADAESLATELGIDYFYLEKSDRFEDVLAELKPIDILQHDRTPHRASAKLGNSVELDPKCHKGVMHYISADGHYMPCCFIHDHRAYYKTPFGKNKQGYQIANNTIVKTVQGPELLEFVNNVQRDQPMVCQMNCPRIGK